MPDGSNAARAARVGRAEVREPGPAPSCSALQRRDRLGEHGGPARVELDADRPPRAAGDRRAEQRAADARERVEDELAGAGEELDQAGHQARRLVRAVRPSPGVAELGRVGRRPHRLREVQPLLAGELVEVVGRVWRRGARSPGQRTRRGGRDGAPAAPRGGQTPSRARPAAPTARARGGTARARPYNAAHAGSRGQSPVHRPGAGARAGRRRRRRVRDGPGDDGARRRAAPGMGVTRFLDEALDRIVARPRAAAVLRGRANGPVDPPWAAVLDALGPAARRAPGRGGRRAAGPRRPPDPARASRAWPSVPSACPDRAPATSPTPSAASRGPSRPCSAGWAGSPPSGRSSSCSRTCTPPTRRPARSRRSWPASRATSGSRSS